MLTTGDIIVQPIPADFDRWGELLRVILDAFAYMDGVIDPPSSALRLTPASLKQKTQDEIGYLAIKGEKLVGCLFLAERETCFYVGKLAVDPGAQGLGIGRRLLETAAQYACRAGKPVLELQTRVELTRNHAFFRHLGFSEIALTAHPHYDHPTSVTMRRELS
jgi:GNAT superfamily N-acetyltransferase